MVRKIKNTLKKGVTLAELVVIIAVLSIISTMVVSFVIMTGESVSSSKQKADALNDLAIVESMMESWLDTELKDLDVIDSKIDLNLTNGSNQLSYDKDTQQLTINKNDTPSTYQTEQIKSIQIIIKELNTKKLAICYITYELAITNKTTKEYTYTFTVYPYSYMGSNTQQGGQ